MQQMVRATKTRCLRTEAVYGLCLKCFLPVDEAHLMDPDTTALWILCSNCCPEHATTTTAVEHELVSK